MPRELITIQVGQCGNQIGLNFWELALTEHSKSNKHCVNGEALSSFFRNVDFGSGNDKDIGTQITDLKARAIVIDMESGVIQNKIKNGKLRDLFDDQQFISDNPGCGNNWAVGHLEFGKKYEAEIIEKVRKTVEHCDSLQGFFFLHSLGGGTGSGFGTYVLKVLRDEYPDVYRFSTCIMPSAEDDVMVSPYNSILAANELIENADCVLPLDNQALFDIGDRIEEKYKKMGKVASKAPSKDMIKQGSSIMEMAPKKKMKEYERENNIVAHLLNNLTCSMRFEGSLNVDLNEITMNLVPYPKLHFLLSSLTPLYALLDTNLKPRNINQMFTDALHRDYQLFQYLACGLILRGDVQISDLNKNIEKMRKNIRMPFWNVEGFKVGLCNQPPLGQSYSLLCLSNNSSVINIFQQLNSKFQRLYKHKTYVFHYTKYGLEESYFDQCFQNTSYIIEEYEALEKWKNNEPDLNSFRYNTLI